ncbi:AAA family ATPase [bacterium]|nr:AAA family ATPase [bacterium]
MKILIDKEINNNNKFLKLDMSQKSSRELYVVYLQAKFRQLLEHDKLSSSPVIKKVKSDFIQRFSQRLINNPNKKILIGISGASASGKSTICNTIHLVSDKLNLPISIVSTDNYFKDISELIKKYGNFDNLRDNGYDIDSPEGFQLEVLKKDLEDISMGNDILSPKYLPNGTGVSVPKAIPVQSKKIIVVEGTAALYIKDLFDINIFIETDEDKRKERFLSRAVTERNQDLENALKHWAYIIEAGKKYINPSISATDLILDGNSDLEYFTQILEYIHTITNNFRD